MLYRYISALTLIVLLCLLGSAVAIAHSGGLDKNGGHHDRKNGGYHYHRGGGSSSDSSSSSSSSSSKSVGASVYTRAANYSDNTVESSGGEVPQVSIESVEDGTAGKFIIRKVAPDTYSVSYRAANQDADVYEHFTVRDSDIEDFSDALREVIVAEVR